MSWSLRLVGADSEERRFRRIAVGMQDLRPFWPLVVPLATSWWKRQFDTEGAFGGKPWAPLSPAYAAAKSVRFPGKGILQATGTMKQKVSDPKRFVTPRSVTLSIDSEVLGYHQEGTERMPARPVVFGGPLPIEARAELDAAAAVYVRDLLGRF